MVLVDHKQTKPFHMTQFKCIRLICLVSLAFLFGGGVGCNKSAQLQRDVHAAMADFLSQLVLVLSKQNQDDLRNREQLKLTVNKVAELDDGLLKKSKLIKRVFICDNSEIWEKGLMGKNEFIPMIVELHSGQYLAIDNYNRLCTWSERQLLEVESEYHEVTSYLKGVR